MELSVDAGYTFTYSESGTDPVLQTGLRVYDDSNNDADVNGDSIDNGVEGSACGTCWSGYSVQLHEELQRLHRC